MSKMVMENKEIYSANYMGDDIKQHISDMEKLLESREQEIECLKKIITLLENK